MIGKNENKPSHPDGWTDDMRPLGDPTVKPPVLEVIDSNAEQNSNQPEVTVEEKDVRDARYWHEQFLRTKSDNEVYAPYKSILEHLKSNVDLVDVLEKHISGEFVEARQANRFGDDEDDGLSEFSTDTTDTSETQVVKPTEEQLANAREIGKQNAQAEMELKQFLQNLMSTGVPEHLTDKFVHTISNPTGFNVADLYAAFENKENRESQIQETTKPKDKEIPMGSPITSAGGSTDKPTGDKFLETPDSDGQNFVSNPNMI